MRDPVFIANAAAQLHRHIADGAEDSVHRRGIHRLAGERAVEIDDMQPLAAGGGEFARLVGRAVVELRRLGHVAMHQPHAFAALEIDRGKQDHGRHPRKFATSLSPAAWLFSGWNCVPAMLSRATIATTSPPYCVCAAISVLWRAFSS